MADAAHGTSQPETDKPQPDTPRYQPLVIVLVAACGGIVADRFGPLPVVVWWAMAAAAWIAWLGLWRLAWESSGAVVLLLAVAATAASWHHCRWRLFAEDDLGCFARAEGQPVCVEVIARQSAREVPPPEFDPMSMVPPGDRCRLEVDAVALRDGTDWRSASGRATLLVDGHLPNVHPGDRLRVFGQLRAPRGAHNPGEFDYADYLRAGRRLSELRVQFPECVSVVEPGRGWGPSRWIDDVRAHGNRILKRHLDPRCSALAAAVLLGAREGLDTDQKQAFVETGTVHLLAISGLHLGILAGALMFVMLRLPIPRGPAMLTVAGLTVFYMLVTDARPPVVRATILVLIMCLALYLHRRPLSFNSLAAAGLIVLALNPAELFQTGAQLSFLAVAGLMWFAPRWIATASGQDPLERMIAESRGWPSRTLWCLGRSLRHLTLVSAMIWLLALPLVMARFHLLTPVAVVLNTVLWLPMALALMSGFATMVLGTVAAPLGQVFGSFCNMVLRLLDSIVGYAREIPGSHFWMPGPPDWWLVGFYGGLGLFAAFPRIRPRRWWCLGLLAGWSAVGFAAAGLRHDGDRLHCTFLSVGHGCAVVLELPSGETVLYDAGRFGSPSGAVRSISGFLWSRGLTRLDAVVLSHADVDHYNALPELLERFSVGVVYVSPVMFDHQSKATVALRDAIRSSGVPLREIHAGDRLAVGKEDCLIEVLHPPELGVAAQRTSVSDNANSVVLKVEYLGHRILLPGDLDSPGLDEMIASEPIDCEVLLAPHHGSRRSNPPGLAAWSTPQWVVVSGGLRADVGPIEGTYSAVGSQVLNTAECGAIAVTMDAAGTKVDRFLPPGE